MPRQDVLLLAFLVFFALALFAALVQIVRVFWQDRAHHHGVDGGVVDHRPLTGFESRSQRPFDHAGCERTYIDLAKKEEA